jgi:hypothetical protein
MRAWGAVSAAIVVGLSGALVTGSAGRQDEGRAKREKVGLTLRVNPPISFSPALVSAVGELKGEPQPDDEILLYCAGVEWDWGDGTRSEAQSDCEPYEAGKSTIKKRFAAQHTYTTAGRYRIQLRLTRNQKTVLATNSSVQVRPGARDFGMGAEP